MEMPWKTSWRSLGKWRSASLRNNVDIDRLQHERDGYRAAYEDLTQQATQWRLDADGYRNAFENLQAEATEWRLDANGYRNAFENLQAEATRWRLDVDGYRNAFENLRADATECRQTADGFRAAYETCCAERALARDERDRILHSVEKMLARGIAPGPGPDGRQICFLHIGKTAGTSLQHALSDAFENAAIFHEELTGFDTVTPFELALNDLVVGHFTYQHVAKLRKDRFLLTFLRDPTERVISAYYFLRGRSPVSDYSRGAIDAARSMSLSEFLRCDHPEVRMITENFQASTLAFDFRPEHRKKIDDLQHQAERNLSEFDFVGIVEHYEASIKGLSRLLGKSLVAREVNLNMERPSQRDIAPQDIELIRQLNVVDQALYTGARDRFGQTFLRERSNLL